jgi:hypothetical protein
VGVNRGGRYSFFIIGNIIIDNVTCGKEEIQPVKPPVCFGERYRFPRRKIKRC